MSDILNGTTTTQETLLVVIVSAVVAFLVAFATGVLINIYFRNKYSKKEAVSREAAAVATTSIFFMVMTAVYLIIGIVLNRLDAIILSILVAGVFGNIAGAKASEVLQNIGAKK